MNDLYDGILVLGLGLALILVVYVFANISYEIRDGLLIMRWRVLRYIPWASAKIRIEDIAEVRRFDFRKDYVGGYSFGYPFTKRTLVLMLRRRFWMARRVFVTPPDPQAFSEAIEMSRNPR